ncbi:CPBP family intramembrane metalloprotease [Halobacteria archaeon AArc-curdl1]|uniref:CPBP family intramembrane metalloprotease n=1 Tax=Natronosalvus hydrolyticus TaxID=2979988 RepID=A0AAP2ZAN4_9EURY|nr:CPBP family intramembrane metalloprotease [Halobacteria archaeon AArc-curdl1]
MRPVVVFLLITAVGTGSLLYLFQRFVFSSLPEGPAGLFATIFFATVLAGFAWLVLRWEGVKASEVGLSSESVLPGAIPVLLIWAGINGAGLVLLFVAGRSGQVGLPAELSLSIWLGLAISQLIFVGIAEEFAFRGYLQNKVIAQFGGGKSRLRVLAGIAVTSILFSLWHIPQRVFVQELAGTDLLPSLVVVGILGAILGVVYELTRNIVFVGVLHGTLNFAPLFVLNDTLQPMADIIIIIVGVPLLVLAVWLYWRWAKTERPHTYRSRTLRHLETGD